MANIIAQGQEFGLSLVRYCELIQNFMALGMMMMMVSIKNNDDDDDDVVSLWRFFQTAL